MELLYYNNELYLIHINTEYETININKIDNNNEFHLITEIDIEDVTLFENKLMVFIENNELNIFIEDCNSIYKYNIDTEYFSSYYFIHDILKINDKLAIKKVNNYIYSIGYVIYNNSYIINLYKNNQVILQITEI